MRIADRPIRHGKSIGRVSRVVGQSIASLGVGQDREEGDENPMSTWGSVSSVTGRLEDPQMALQTYQEEHIVIR